MAKRKRVIPKCIVCGYCLGSSCQDTETTCEECMKEPLEPCPFCGKPAKIHLRRCCFWIVCCRDTKCPGHNIGITYNSRREAASSWNRRYYK